MKIPSIPPWVFASVGAAITVAGLLTKGSFDPYILAFWLIAAIVETFAKKQKRIPSLAITFVTSFLVIMFVRTNVIMLKTVPNASAEPYISEGAAVFYQPSFYSIKRNDLIIIKSYKGSNSLICKVLEVGEQSYKVEIVSRREVIETSKDNLEGKIVYVTNGGKKKGS